MFNFNVAPSTFPAPLAALAPKRKIIDVAEVDMSMCYLREDIGSYVHFVSLTFCDERTNAIVKMDCQREWSFILKALQNFNKPINALILQHSPQKPVFLPPNIPAQCNPVLMK